MSININVRNFHGAILWARFKGVLKRRGLRLAEGLAEAIEDWLERHETVEEKRHARQEVGL